MQDLRSACLCGLAVLSSACVIGRGGGGQKVTPSLNHSLNFPEVCFIRDPRDAHAPDLELVIEEDEARKVDILGAPFNIVIPDGGGDSSGSSAPSASATFTSTGMQSRVRDAAERRAETDSRDRQFREEEMGPAATLKVAALWLVLISQLWLLLVFWNDPMGDTASILLRD